MFWGKIAHMLRSLSFCRIKGTRVVGWLVGDSEVIVFNFVRKYVMFHNCHKFRIKITLYTAGDDKRTQNLEFHNQGKLQWGLLI